MNNGQEITLFSNVASGTSTDEEWAGGRGRFIAVAGTWSTAVVTLQFQTKDGSWVEYATGISAANGWQDFILPRGRIRGVISGGGTPVGIYAYAIATPAE